MYINDKMYSLVLQILPEKIDQIDHFEIIL